MVLIIHVCFLLVLFTEYAINPYKPRLNEVLARAMKLTYVIRHTISVLNQYFNLYIFIYFTIYDEK